MKRHAFAALLAAAVLTSACGSSSNGIADAISPALGDAACSTVGQNRFVYEIMQDIYYWNAFLPTVDPDSFASPEELLEAIRYQVLDPNLSSIVDEEDNTRFFEQGQFIGVGLTLRTLGNQVFVGQVLADSPAGDAGFLRGFEILEINGQAAADLIASDSVSEAFGPDEVGTQVELRYRDLQANEFTVTIAKALVDILPVPFSTVFDVNGVQTGYLMFRYFIEPSVAALDSVFADFRNQGVTEVILDLRYNGGGRVSVAEHLGGLIGGAATAGQVFGDWVHNSNNTSRNFTSVFPAPAQALGISRLIVITTSSTASASELVISALRPYMQVVLIGDTTFGKPVGSYGFTFCGKVLNPISFAIFNADGEGEYFDGLTVDCAAEDELGAPFGDAAEASTAEALYYVENGVCSAATASANRSLSLRASAARPVAGNAWQRLLGVF